MADAEPIREYLVAGFQVGLAPDTVGIQLQLLGANGAILEGLVLRLTPAMADVLSDHLREASAALALGPSPTDVKQ